MHLSTSLPILLIGWSVIAVSQSTGPVVTLDHGGSIEGLSTTYNSQPVDLFLGVRFAKAPVGNLRFKKPQELPSWRGTLPANAVGNACTQNDFFGQTFGEEDCLFLSVTVPGGVQPGANKAVMVWFHGGAFAFGKGSAYIGAPIATTGDVIVVSINYRLGIFGFLSDGPGTGNFALWDQRRALQWVQRHISRFGGNPNMVTIFGESAGGRSVAAQMLHPENAGLFQRAIQQSGSLFIPNGWYLSRNGRQQLVNTIRDSLNCTSTGKVYDCFNGLTNLEVQNAATPPGYSTPWHPVPDGDFFPEDFEENPSYALSGRFDLMSGMNGQEAALELFYDLIAFVATRNETIENGVSLQLATDFLTHRCTTWLTPMAAELCADFVINTYRLHYTRSDRDRGARLSYFVGELLYDVDIVRQLREHSKSKQTSTYAFYFTEFYEPVKDIPFKNIPDWLKRSAVHTDELPFLFGGAFLQDESSTIWQDLIADDFLTANLFNQTLSRYYRHFSMEMMKMWTNFAKTGNPNTPASLSSSRTWPEFDITSGKFMNLNSRYPRVINTPNKERLEKLETRLLSARDLQVNSDKPCAV